ncbi:MAG: SufD family Fe-S cluster assembly protein [Cyanobacteria bacterium]|nr:SufD family Fe-S cluster assembly protein [Cyanobacteriota bacterium]
MVTIPVGELRVQSRPNPGEAWLADLLATLPALAGNSLLATQQQRCRQALAGEALPSRRQEAWRFTDASAITAIPAQPLQRQPAAAEAALPAPPANVLRLVLAGSGDPLQGVALPEGLERLESGALEELFGEALDANGAAAAWPVCLNGAVAGQVLALRVSQPVPTLLELVSDTGDAAGVQALRLLLVLDPGASLAVLEVHRARGASLTSVVLEARLGRGARLRHGLLAQGQSPHQPAVAQRPTSACAAPVLLHHLAAVQDPDSELELIAAVAGWGLARLEPLVLQRSGAASTRLRGLQRVDGSQVVDTHSRVLFSGPDGRLDQVHKALADGAGRSVFNGAVIVPRQAQRTDAAQLSRSLLLSDRARIDTKPELEIVADDVKCAHGATVSRLQQNELFYLQSRGIGADQAARLLLRGFCEEVLAELPAPAALWQPLALLMGEDPAP